MGGKRAKELESVICNARMFLCQQEISKDGNYEALKMASENGGKFFIKGLVKWWALSPYLLIVGGSSPFECNTFSFN